MIVLSGITIQSKIYESSASLVYRGLREEDSQAIVIKLLKQDYPSPQELTRYRQEYAVTRFLNIEGVIRAYNQQDYQRTLVILLEDFFGESLEYWIQQRPEAFCPMPVSNFFPLAINLSKILGRIHAANVIHKDINPGNIVLNPNTGVVKIIDFGIATQFSRTNPTFKSPHGLEGTLTYLSPEQTGRMNRLIDYRTDFYSLGVTFYELLTGQVPFPTTDVLELVHCHLAKPPIPPCELNPKLPKPVSDIILKLMAKNGEDRYQSAWGIKADLEDCAYQLETSGQINPFQPGLQDVSDQFQIPQKLYGREEEIAALLAAFERVAGREDAQRTEGDAQRDDTSASPPYFRVLTSSEMMLVSGYSGVGKSALVQELYKPITARRGYFISGKFDQLQRNIPYSAIVDALHKLVQQLLGELDKQVQQWRSRLLEALGSNGQLIIDVIPEVELIIGKQPPVPEVGATEAQNRFNRVFQQFIRVFCAKEHPLVIFLDDLQWIDSATIQLIELMLLDEQTQSLFLIGAYRDNEVSPTHPLVLMLEGLRHQGAVFEEIVLAPLTLEPLAQLTAETLHQDTNTVRRLAELVLRKTGGNPFFVGEFLQLLYSENLLSFNTENLSWQWDIAQIEAQNITDNVVELLVLKLKKLPENTQQLLQLAACIGAEFDLETLAIVFKQSPKTVSQDLLAAIQSGLIHPLSELDENLLIQEYKFLHDRVQQAAYALIDELQKQGVHLQIGRNLLEKSSLERITERLFEIVDHLNHGIALATDQAERDEIAKLNLQACQKAKAAIAYSVAKSYLAIGRAWLAASSWQTDYELTLKLYSETTEVAYLCGELEQVEHWAGIVLQQAKTILDKAKIYEVKIQTCIAQKKLLEAIKIGLQALKLLGVALPESPTKLDIQRQLEETKAFWYGKNIEYLSNLPVMTDAKKLAAMRLLSSLFSATFIAAPALLLLTVCKQVNLSIKHGNVSFSAFVYASYGTILNGVVQDIESAYQFGSLALSLVERLNADSINYRTFNLVAATVLHGKIHVRETITLFQASYQNAIENGDLEWAGYAAHNKCLYSYFNGSGLTELEREIKTISNAIARLKQETALTWCQTHRQVVLNLLEQVENPCRLQSVAYNEEKLLPLSLAANDRTGLHIFYIHKLILCYLFRQFTQAVENAVQAEQYLDGATGWITTPVLHFYDSLARLAVHPFVRHSEQKHLLLKVTSNQEKMQIWARHAPMNHLHKFYLVEAEKARVLGQFLEAEELYEQAIQGARDNGYIQEEALVYELAAKHYLARGREKFAQLYMKESHYCYERWGAIAKVKDLEIRYPQFFSQSPNVAPKPVRTTAGTTSNTSQVAIDLATVMKASQAISSEIDLERLLHFLMQSLIENAGAQTGCLLLENAGEWKIAATCELSEGTQVCATRVLQSIPIVNCLPESIIQYVIRTHDSVILNDATREGHFINDSYIQRHQTQSVLCLPLLNQTKLVGVLYLENQLATGIFSPERSQLLNLLSTQAAIAIENAKLYSEQRASKSQMTQFLEAIPVGVAVLDATGRPYYANQRAIQLMGKGIDPSVPPEHIAESYQFYLAGTDQTYPNERLPIIRALSGERTRIDDMEILHQDIRIPVEGWGTPAFDEQGNVAYAIVTFQDITERKKAEQLLADYNRTLEQQVAERTAALQQSEAELRYREQELRLITDALPVCITYIDANQRYRFANRTYEEWFHRSRGEILGKHICENLGEAAYQVVQPYINQALVGEVTTYEAEIPCEFGKKYISNSLIPDFDDNGQVKGYYGLISDISDRRRAEKASILEERNRMAREIHDTLAQAFTGILLHVGSITQMLADDSGSAQIYLERLEKIDELARIGLAEARRSVIALRPQLLEENTLQSALHRLVTQMQSSTKTALIYESKGVMYSLPTEVENHLLRIGQEALTNAIKYANASKILVELVYDDAQCLLRIQDDGQGFGVGTISSLGGFGLLGMSERAERIGAHLAIQSQPGQGAEIIVIVNRE